MSKLLFAAARGARIQMFSPTDLEWVPVIKVAVVPTKFSFRIHPDDEHLQYGPISTVLREEAEDYSGRSWNIGTDISAELRYGAWHDCRYADPLTRSLFLLILAEALADEGL